MDGLFKLGPAKTLFDKVAVPIVITYGGENVASGFLSRLAGKTAQRAAEGRAKDALNGRNGSGNGTEQPSGPRRSGQVLEQSTVSTKFLLHLAFVNMDKGIGRGW
jgi:hypothetical protein